MNGKRFTLGLILGVLVVGALAHAQGSPIQIGGGISGGSGGSGAFLRLTADNDPLHDDAHNTVLTLGDDDDNTSEVAGIQFYKANGAGGNLLEFRRNTAVGVSDIYARVASNAGEDIEWVMNNDFIISTNTASDVFVVDPSVPSFSFQDAGTEFLAITDDGAGGVDFAAPAGDITIDATAAGAINVKGNVLGDLNGGGYWLMNSTGSGGGSQCAAPVTCNVSNVGAFFACNNTKASTQGAVCVCLDDGAASETYSWYAMAGTAGSCP